MLSLAGSLCSPWLAVSDALLDWQSLFSLAGSLCSPWLAVSNALLDWQSPVQLLCEGLLCSSTICPTIILVEFSMIYDFMDHKKP